MKNIMGNIIRNIMEIKNIIGNINILIIWTN